MHCYQAVVETSQPKWLRKLMEMLPSPQNCSSNIIESIQFEWTVLQNKRGEKFFKCFRNDFKLVFIQLMVRLKTFAAEVSSMSVMCWLVSVVWRDFTGNSLLIVSAANCVKKTDLTWRDLTHVRVGRWNVNDFGDFEIIDKIVFHGYQRADENQHFDIALLRLAKKVKFDDFDLKPICLPLDASLRTKDYAGHSFVVSGLYSIFSLHFWFNTNFIF